MPTGLAKTSLAVARGGRLLPCSTEFTIGSWNIEGYTIAKQVELEQTMEREGIGVLCIQETWQTLSDTFVTDTGYLVVLSGGAEDRPDDPEDRAGVGFIVAPSVRRSVVAFRQATSRLASLKLRIVGGKAAVVSAYAPHSGKDFLKRQSFFNELSDFVRKLSAHGPKLIMGDMNARLHEQFVGESLVVGPHVFASPGSDCKPDANRHLLVEACTQFDMCLANTFFELPLESLATCYNVGRVAGEAVNLHTHSQIDFLVCEQNWLHNVRDVRSFTNAPLSSHHFLLHAVLHMEMEKCAAEQKINPDLRMLMEPCTRRSFAQCFSHAQEQYEEAAPDHGDVNVAWSRMVDGFRQAEQTTLTMEGRRPTRPWTSSCTLNLVARRREARRQGDPLEEKTIAKQIKASVARDRAHSLQQVTKEIDGPTLSTLLLVPNSSTHNVTYATTIRLLT